MYLIWWRDSNNQLQSQALKRNTLPNVILFTVRWQNLKLKTTKETVKVHDMEKERFNMFK